MNWFLLILSVMMNFGACLAKNDWCKRTKISNAQLYLFNAVNAFVAMLVLLVITACMGQLQMPSLYTLLMGIGFGIITALQTLLNMTALKIGPLSYTTVIISCSMIIPALSGFVLYAEPIIPGQIIAIILMLLSILFSVDKKSEESTTSVKWLLLCLGAFLLTGGIGVMQKLHQSSPYKDELGMFLVLAFAVNGLFSLLFARGGSTGGLAKIPGSVKLFWVYALISGIGGAANNEINLYLSGVMPSIIFYPVVNGLGMLLNCGAGLIFWREKLNKKQWLGLVLGAAAILLLSF